VLDIEDSYLEKVEETYYEGLDLYSKHIKQLNTEKTKTVESEELKKAVYEEKSGGQDVRGYKAEAMVEDADNGEEEH
jgi:hypothetical protein